ncbi:MAG: hypothetical protein N3G74_00885 [Candidatus Micrarchaeota archaeon]|nr:hypothetical protein [Candidatus Micrarchaeota archaeon]
MNPDIPIRIYEITAGTIAIEKVKLAPISDEEAEILNKLLQIKFEERTPDAVKSSFSSEEMKRLEDLIRKHLVTVYYGGKYSQTGVYNIPNLVYRQLLDKKHKEMQQKSEQPVSVQRKEDKQKKDKKEAKKDENLVKKLNKDGYLVLQSESDARELSKSLSDKIEKNQVTGIRGFDKKYYLVKNSFVLKNQSKIKSFLNSGPKSAEQIAKELDIPQEAAIALLTVLREEGEIIEKRKGTFSLID